MTAKSSLRSRGGLSLWDSPAALFARALLLGIASAVLLLLLFTAVAYEQPDPASVVQPLALAALVLSSVLCGVFAGRPSENPLLAGAVSGAIYMLVLTLLSLLSLGDASGEISALWNIILHASVIAASVLGAWIGRKRRARPSLQHKKRRR